MQYLILSKSRSINTAYWWRPVGEGFTNDVDKAGQFSEEESTRIIAKNKNTIRVPVSAIGRTVVTRRIVDAGDSGNYAELMMFEGK